jgi:hypothetical protein
MSETHTHTEPSKFFDVFISYRHRDAGRIEKLKEKIRSLGYSAFQDTDFREFRDTKHIPGKKVDALRHILSQATCLIFAYSRDNPETKAEADSPVNAVVKAGADSSVGAWMPWELGFFDGSISDRIGIYLLDGTPEHFRREEYFRHSEYLQVYQPLTDENLEAFLDRYAVRERRVDNVNSAFVWFEHLRDECLANPTNVGLGIAEWFADYWARYGEECGNELLAKTCKSFKDQLDDWRVSWVRLLRWPLADAWVSELDNQWQHALTTLAASSIGGVAKPPTGTPLPAKSREPWLPPKRGAPMTVGPRIRVPF